MFSAIAMVAFSFAGMANEIEEKKVEMETIKFEKVEVERVVLADCNSVRVALRLAMLGAGFSDAEATAYSYQYYFGCLRNNSPFL